jgi:putative transposase
MPEINHFPISTAPMPLLSESHEDDVRVPCLDDLMPDDLHVNDLVVISGRLLQYVAKEEHGPLVFFDGDEKRTVRLRTSEIIDLMNSGEYVRPGGDSPSSEDIAKLNEAERQRLRMLFGSVRAKPRKNAQVKYLYVGHYLSKIVSARADNQVFARTEPKAKIVIEEVDAILKRHNEDQPDASKHLLRPRCIAPRTVLGWVENELKHRLGEVGQVHGNALIQHERKLPQMVFDIIAETIREMVSVSGKIGPTKIFHTVCGKIRELNKLKQIILPTPGKTLVYNEYRRYDAWIRLARRKDARAAELEFGAIGKLQRPKRVNDLWEVDHHKFDVHVVLGAVPWSENSLPRVLARAGIDRFWICLALDGYSGYPTGFCVSFEPGGLTPALTCIDHAVRIKDYVEKRWPHINGALIGFGKPVRLRYDNAKEFVSLQMAAALARIQIGFAHARRRQPDSKPYIERHFGTLERDFIEWLKGATGANPKEKGDKDPVKEAKIEADDFLMLLHQYFIECYARRPQENLGWRTPEQVWMAALEHPTCRPRPLTKTDLDRLDIIASVEDEVTATREGIKWKGLYYQSPELQKLRRTSGIGYRGGNGVPFRARIPVKNIGVMYVAPQLVNDQEEIAEIKVPCTNPTAHGLTLWQHKVVRAELEARKADPENWADYQAGYLRLFRSSLRAMGVKLPGEEPPRKARLTGGQAPRFAGVFLAGPEHHALHNVRQNIERFDVFGEIAAVAAAASAATEPDDDITARVEQRISRWTADPIDILQEQGDGNQPTSPP